ncbi:uncharacterized protein LOC116351273 isoform X1 [Contarinia nasturtii]|uniref:uncharacterized protein LOC116351273 isoform X1 n=1 Tax=Contarinia nasturtii TaxID=265458 RepID=UPI0012D3FB7A|nr:uncharacterized protein LOC116351273 isoform X1 [Contarinia nasturtii]
MNLLKAIYKVYFGDKQKIHLTNNAVQFYWTREYILSLPRIHSAFKHFGEIKNITILRVKNYPLYYRYVIVEFITSQEAHAALLKRQITIRHHNIIVKPCEESNFVLHKKFCSTGADQTAKIEDILLQPPDEESPKNILNALNDDCLYEVFKRMHPSNYVLIGNVCVRFDRILKEMIGRKYKNKMFHITDIQLFTLFQADDYLRYFGSSIYQAEVNFDKVKRSTVIKIYMILIMISEHCVNLRYFRSINFPMDEQFVNEIIPLFTRIEKLSIKRTQKIRKYHSGFFRPSVFIPAINCPKLVAFEWDDMWFVYHEDIPALINFLYHNTQLRSFLYFSDNLGKCNDDEKYYLPTNISILSQFKCLKFLSVVNGKKIHFGKHSNEELIKIKPLMQELKTKNMPIEYLKLFNTVVDDTTIEYISQIRTIKKFAFLDYNYYKRRCPTRDVIESYIFRLESSLPNLEVLQFQTSDSIDIIFTDEHIHIIEKNLRKKIPRLKLDIHKLNDTANTFTDKYNLTTITNTYRTEYRTRYRIKSFWDVRDFRLMIREYSTSDLNVQRYWITLSSEDEGVSKRRHISDFPLFEFPFEPF